MLWLTFKCFTWLKSLNSLMLNYLMKYCVETPYTWADSMIFHKDAIVSLHVVKTHFVLFEIVKYQWNF